MNWKDARDLDEWARTPRFGLITDVDGTISPIASTPDSAQVTLRAKQYLTELARLIPLTGVISGRAASDVQGRVGVEGMVYMGNHGMERVFGTEVIVPQDVSAYRPQIKHAYEELIAQLLPGMRLEDKGATLSVHYRLALNPDEVVERFRPLLRLIESRHGLSIHEGRLIFEIRPPLLMNKGTAFLGLVKEYELEAAAYIGDDTTDVDALMAAKALRDNKTCYALGFGVNSEEAPPSVIENADYTVDGIPDVEAFLAWLIDQRRSMARY